MIYLALRMRASLLSLRYPFGARAIHSTKAEFVTNGSRGSLESRIVDVWLGDPYEAFTLVPPEIGNAFKVARLWQSGLTMTKDPDICPLTFYHDTHHFAHGACHEYLCTF